MQITAKASLVCVLFLLITGNCFTAGAADIQYRYDALNRLTKAQYPDGMVIEYTYDALGNRTSRTVRQGEETDVSADIKANGSDDPVTIAPGDPLLVTIGLDPGDQAGERAEYWVYAEAPSGAYSYVHPRGWQAGSRVTARAPLAAIPSFTVLSMNNLPDGDYTFHFGVDLTMNGSMDTPAANDSVSVTVGTPSMWSAGAAMPTARYWHASAVSGNYIYLIGGSGAYSSFERYNPAADTWIKLSNLPFSGYLLRAAAVNGMIYVFDSRGGVNPVWSYDIADGTWQQLGNMPENKWISEAAVVNGKIYLFGGINSAIQAVATTLEYDPAVDQWTTKRPMPTARYASATAVYNGKIYVLGGNYGQRKNEIYDPAADTWQTKSSMPSSFADYGWSVAGQTGGKIYLVQATDDTDNATAVYSPAEDTWSLAKGLPVPRDYLSGEVSGASIYVFGGKDGKGSTSDSTDIGAAADIKSSAGPDKRQKAGDERNQRLQMHLRQQRLLQGR